MTLNKNRCVDFSWGDGGGAGPDNRRSFSILGPLPEKEWVHIAATWAEDDAVRLYVNGEEVQTQRHGGGGKVDHKGGRGALGVRFMGMMDDVVVWPRALVGEEIRRVYELTREQ